jgi:hypothetical protein
MVLLRPEVAAGRVGSGSSVVFVAAASKVGPTWGLPMPGRVQEEALKAAAGRAGDCRW